MQQLRKAIGSKDQLKKFEGSILDALEGKFQSASDMRISLLNGLSHSQPVQQPKSKPKVSRPVSTSPHVNSSATHSRYQNHRNKKSSHFLETVLVVMIVSLLYVLYIYGELM
jgi:hypothetical protein